MLIAALCTTAKSKNTQICITCWWIDHRNILNERSHSQRLYCMIPCVWSKARSNGTIKWNYSALTHRLPFPTAPLSPLWWLLFLFPLLTIDIPLRVQFLLSVMGVNLWWGEQREDCRVLNNGFPQRYVLILVPRNYDYYLIWQMSTY